IASWSAYITRYGVMIPVLSAGSNQDGVSATCTPNVNWPGVLAPAGSAVAARPMAARASTSRLESINSSPLRPEDAVIVFSLKAFSPAPEARPQAATGWRGDRGAQATLARSAGAPALVRFLENARCALRGYTMGTENGGRDNRAATTHRRCVAASLAC